MELKYWGRTFTSPEEVEAYDRELLEKWRISDYKDDKVSKERYDFNEAVGYYILDLLRTLTVDFDLKKFDKENATPEELEQFEVTRNQLYEDIVGLGNIIDFWYDWRFEEKMCSCYLEKSYANMIYYYRDYKDKSLFFALECEDSPYEPWYNEEYSFYAVKRKPVVSYVYLDYDDEEVKNL